MEGEVKFTIGDQVKIIKGPPGKLGKVGTIKTIFINGAIVELNPNWFTPIRYVNLEKING